MRLFDICAKDAELLATIADMEGEITDEIAEQLAINANDLEEKITNYRGYIDQLTRQAEYFKDKADEFKAKQKRLTNTIEVLKDKLKMAINVFGVPTYDKKTGEYKNKTLTFDEFKMFSVHLKPAVVDDMEELPNTYKLTTFTLPTTKAALIAPEITAFCKKVSIDADKDSIKSSINAGIDVKGAHIDTESFYVRFT